MLIAQAWSLAATPFVASPLASLLLLAQEEQTKQYTLPWAAVLLCVGLGMLITLKVSKREPTEDKQPKA